MANKEEKKILLKFKQALQANPVSVAGRKNLRGFSRRSITYEREHFFNNKNGKYVEPFSHKLKENIIYSSTHIDNEEDTIRIDAVNYNDLDKIHNDFTEQTPNNIIIISGEGGVGKTTFLHKNIYDLEKNNFKGKPVNTTVFDMDKFCRKSIGVSNIRYYDELNHEDFFSKPIGLLCISLVAELLNIIKFDDSTYSDFKGITKDIKKRYQTYFNVSKLTKVWDFFKLFDYGHVSTPGDISEYENIEKRLIEYFYSIIYLKKDNEYGVVGLSILYNIILRLLFCLNNSDEQSIYSLVCIDNVETFIGENLEDFKTLNDTDDNVIENDIFKDDTIYDYREDDDLQVHSDDYEDSSYIESFEKDTDEELVIPISGRSLKRIWKTLREAITFTSEALEEYFGNDVFRQYFLVVFSVRKTTIDFFDYPEFSESTPLYDITNWFDMNTISSRKEEYLTPEERSILHECREYRLYKRIIEDYQKIGLDAYSIISGLCNDNIRLSNDLLIDILLSTSEDTISEILKYWEKAEKARKENMINDNTFSSTIYLCRRAVLKLMCDHYKRCMFLDDIGIITPRFGRNIDFISYPRRILTYLRGQYLQHNSNRIQEPTSDNFTKEFRYTELHDVLNNTVICDPITGISDATAKKLAHILFLLSQQKKNNLLWTPLITLDLHSTDKISRKHLISCIKNPKNTYHVKINHSGILFAEINSDFEFYSAKFIATGKPLIATTLLMINRKDGKKEPLSFYIADNVFKHTKKLINQLIRRDNKFYESLKLVNPNDDGMYGLNRQFRKENEPQSISHPQRVLRKHRGYLGAFEIFVNNVADIDDDNKKEILSKINSVIKKYDNYIRELKRNYPKYFEYHEA